MENYNTEVNNLKKCISIVIFFFFGVSALLVGCNNVKTNEENITPEVKSRVNLKIMTTNKLLSYMVKDIVKD